MSLNQHKNLESEKLLHVLHLRKCFPSPTGEKIAVLRDVSFTVARGETIAIIGASGAGKSTLLHLLGGLEAPDAGSIQLNGLSLEAANGDVIATFRNSQIGFVFQFHHLLPDFSAVENVAMPLIIAGVRRREALVRARHALSLMGLERRTEHSVAYLSGGEQQRIAVARALINEPAVVLADEPTGNLDAALEREITEQLMSYVRSGGGALVIATHNNRLAAGCDRVLLLKNGVLERH